MKNRYEVSEAFKNSCKANIGLNRYGRIHVVEDNIDIVGENYDGQLVDFTIEDNCYVDDTFIGTTNAKKITINILNPNNLINLENKTIEVYTGIFIDERLEEIPYGTYIIEKPNNEEVKQKTSFIGYDYMIKFNVPYKDRVTYPTKTSTLLSDLCNQVGLELGNTDFTNADYMILGNPFTNNEDCKTVLSNIAQLAGGFARIGRDNKVYIKTLKKAPKEFLKVKEVHNMPVKDLHVIPVNMLASYRDSADEYIDGMNYFEDFTKNNKWGEINSLVLSLSSIEGENTVRTNEGSIAKNGLTEIKIEDNYFLTNEEERNKVIEPLWESLKEIYYLPFKTKYYGYPHLDSGDAIAIEDTQNIQYFSYVFNHTFIFNGAFDGNIDTPAMTKTQTAYKNTNDLKSKFKRVERSIDKVNGVILDVVEQQTETEKKLSKHEQTIDSITDTVSNVENKLENDYYTKEETNSKITQKADSITSEVNKSISTAKQEAINSANSSTDNKLRNYSTTTEMNSKITQTAEEINTEVRKKVGEDEICSIISQSADKITIKSNRISIQSSYFTLDENGNIKATSGTIGGFTLGSTEFSGNLNGVYNFNYYDCSMIRAYIMNNNDMYFPSTLFKIFDMNGDGQVEALDYIRIRNIIEGRTENTKTMTGTIKINSKDPKNSIAVYDGSEVCVSLGIGGINANLLATKSIICSPMPNTNTNFSGIVINGSTSTITFSADETVVGKIVTYSNGIGLRIPNSSAYIYIADDQNSSISKFEKEKISFFRNLDMGGYNILNLGSDKTTSKSINNSYFSGTVYLSKYGKIVTAIFQLTAKQNLSSTYTSETLNLGEYAPYREVHNSVQFYGKFLGTCWLVNDKLNIATNGTISSGTTLQIDMTYRASN